MSKKHHFGIFDFSTFDISELGRELTEEELFIINGGSCGGGGTGNYATNSGDSSNSNTNDYSSSSNSSILTPTTSATSSCSSSMIESGSSVNNQQEEEYDQPITATRVNQRSFSCGNGYTNEFGNNACAVTSLLNEISEQYTKETGKVITTKQVADAMKAAVDSGCVNAGDAYVNNWAGAANAMATSLGLDGTYSYSSNSSVTDAKLFAVDNNGDGRVDHFVNDIGNGQYYDPWNGTIGKVSDLILATKGLGGTRNLSYVVKN